MTVLVVVSVCDCNYHVIYHCVIEALIYTHKLKPLTSSDLYIFLDVKIFTGAVIEIFKRMFTPQEAIALVDLPNLSSIDKLLIASKIVDNLPPVPPEPTVQDTSPSPCEQCVDTFPFPCEEYVG